MVFLFTIKVSGYHSESEEGAAVELQERGMKNWK